MDGVFFAVEDTRAELGDHPTAPMETRSLRSDTALAEVTGGHRKLLTSHGGLRSPLGTP